MKALFLKVMKRMTIGHKCGFYYPKEEQKFLQHEDEFKVQLMMSLLK